MKTYALVNLADLQHMTDEHAHVMGVQAEAHLRGETLILVKPMATILDRDRSEAMREAIEKRDASAKTDPWSTLMSAIDNLRAEVEALKTEVADNKAKHTAALDKVAEQTAKYNEALAKLNALPAVSNEPEIQAIADELHAITKELDSVTAEPAPTEPAAPAEPAPDAPPA